MEFKTTKRLFKGIYQYKVVLICPGATWFRSGDMSATLENLKKVNFDSKKVNNWYHHHAHIKTPEDLDYALKLQNALSKMSDIDIRVESPWITIYTNNKKDTEILSKLDESHVKYISMPVAGKTLQENTVVMPKMNFDFRVTLGKTTSENLGFVEWAKKNAKVKLTKSCIRDLNKPRSWGGTHFYITGDNNLLLAKMHLGDSIAKIERIVK
jgi:hypothetical protein